MKPVLQEELSALLDGELDVPRAREVEMQIAADPQLRAEFARLVETDVRWRAAAASAAFAPTMHMPPEHTTASSRSAAVVVALASGLIWLRLAPRWFESLPLDVGLHTAALAILLAGLLWTARADQAARGPIS